MWETGLKSAAAIDTKNVDFISVSSATTRKEKRKRDEPPDVPDDSFDWKLAVNYARKALLRNNVTNAHVDCEDIASDAKLRWFNSRRGKNGKAPNPISTRRAARYATKEYLRAQEVYRWFIRVYDDKGGYADYGASEHCLTEGYSTKRAARAAAKALEMKERNIRFDIVHMGDSGRTFAGKLSKGDMADFPDARRDIVDVLPDEPKARALLTLLSTGMSQSEVAAALNMEAKPVSRMVALLRDTYFVTDARRTGEALPAVKRVKPIGRAPDTHKRARVHVSYVPCRPLSSPLPDTFYFRAPVRLPMFTFIDDNASAAPSSLSLFTRFLSSRERTFTLPPAPWQRDGREDMGGEEYYARFGYAFQDIHTRAISKAEHTFCHGEGI